MIDPLPIDAAQLVRIESTHKGFLYQHLVGVACMFQVALGHGRAVIVERDEDIEVDHENGRWYIQVKNLKDLLCFSDIAPSLALFDRLRSAHLDGARTGIAQFFVVSSSNLGPHLAAAVAAEDWPKDVQILTPSRPNLECRIEVHEDVVRQWQYTVRLAHAAPHSRATPETLTWKLAAIIQSLATGAFADGRHRLDRPEIEELFEQVVALVDRLPQPPALYRPQESEPELSSDDRIRIIAGAGGSGKTSWAAQAALHAPVEIVYARSRETEGRNFAAWISSHLIANLFPRKGCAAADVFQPGALGAEPLRRIDAALEPHVRNVLVLVDDAHLLDAESFAMAVQGTLRIRWLVLGRPSESLSRIADRLSLEINNLSGWSNDVISQVMAANDVICDPRSVSEVRRITNGAPMFVENIAKLAAVEENSLGEYLANFLRGAHGHTTALERFLECDVLDHLSSFARNIAVALTYVLSPLPLPAIRALAQATCGGTEREVGLAVRSLIDWRVVISIKAREYGLHDTFRSLAVQHRANLTSTQRAAAARVIKECLAPALQVQSGLPYQLVDYMRALGELGEIDVLADMASGHEEWFREHGVSEDVEAVLTTAINGSEGSNQGRFLVADSLAFMALEAGDRPRAAGWIALQEKLLGSIGGDTRDIRVRLATKHVLLAKLDRDVSAARKVVDDALRWLPRSSVALLVLQYNFALVAVDAEDADIVEHVARSLIAEYLAHLRLTIAQILEADAPEIWATLGPGDHTDALRHLADCWFLLGRGMSMKGASLRFEFTLAMKLYDMADAPSSFLRTAGEVVDQLLWSQTTADPLDALRLLETTILPTMERRGLVDQLLELRSLQAVALGCVGRHADARSVLRTLEPYYRGLIAHDSAVFNRRAAMVEGLASGELRYANGQLVDRQGLPAFTEPVEV